MDVRASERNGREGQSASEARGARQVFAEAALDCRERLWWLALRLTRSAADAEDLLQATYVRAFERWQQQSASERMVGWLMRIMRSCFVDRCRHDARRPVSFVADLGDGPEEAASDATELRDSLEKAVADLPLPIAEAWRLRELWGFSYEEIAVMMACPVGTVRSRIARARQHLMNHFDDRSGLLPAGVEATSARSR